jgi:hypothetical protein
MPCRGGQALLMKRVASEEKLPWNFDIMLSREDYHDGPACHRGHSSPFSGIALIHDVNNHYEAKTFTGSELPEKYRDR